MAKLPTTLARYLQPQNSTEDPKDVRVVLFGKSGAGKTTLMNSLFDLGQETALSAEPETVGFKDHTPPERHGVRNNNIVITDTAGMLVWEKKDLKKVKELFKEINQYVKDEPAGMKKHHLILFCIPVRPGSRFHDGTPTIMKSLQKYFGKTIWKHCKIIFTYSNEAWTSCKKQPSALEKYITHLKSYARLFEEELSKLGVHDVVVRTTFENQNEDQSTIVALQAGFLLGCEMPDISSAEVSDNASEQASEALAVTPSDDTVQQDSSWKDVIFLQLAKTSNDELTYSLLRQRFGTKVAELIMEALRAGIHKIKELNEIIKQSKYKVN